MGVFETKIANFDFWTFLFWPQKYKDCHSLHNIDIPFVFVQYLMQTAAYTCINLPDDTVTMPD